jgi:hypothetical protein
VIPQRCLDVHGKLRGHRRPRWPRTIATVGRRPFDSWRFQSPPGFELGVTLPIHGRPSAARSPRRELLCVPPVIQALDETVDPTEAQCLVTRVLVVD